MRARMMHTGSICFQWSALESLLAVVIWRLLKLESDTGAIVTGGLDILPRINMAIALAHHLKAKRHVTKLLRDTRTIIQEDLMKRRNLAVHGILMMDEETGDGVMEMHRGGKRSHWMPVDELKSLANEINALSGTLNAGLQAAGFLDPIPADLMAKYIRSTISEARKTNGS